jgi:hypothetical protein
MMKCARCGGDIPEGSPSCPECGLKVRIRPPGTEPPPPVPQAPPAVSHPEQDLPPGAIRVSEPSSPGEWPPRDLRAGPPPTPDQGKRKVSNVVIAVIVICLLVVGGAAAAYFLAFREKSTSGAEAAVEGFVRASYTRDIEAEKSFLTPDMQKYVDIFESHSSQSGVRFEVTNIKLKTLEESGDKATVQLVDLTLQTSTSGFTNSATLKQLESLGGVHGTVFKLKKQNGKWLITGFQST